MAIFPIDPARAALSTLVDGNGNTLGRITDLVIEGVTPTAAHDHLADTFPEELGNRRFVTVDLESSSLRELAARVGGPFDASNINAVYGKSGSMVESVERKIDAIRAEAKINITALPRGGVMLNGSANQLRNYIMRDIEITEELKKRAEIDSIIDEALAMQRRGRPAPLPRPTYLAVAIRAIYDDIESWSRP